MKRNNKNQQKPENSPKVEVTEPEKQGICSFTKQSFHVPHTKGPLHSLADFDIIDIITWASTLLPIILIFLFGFSGPLLIFNTLFWRLGYNAGIGYVLHRQSTSQWLTKLVIQYQKTHGSLIEKICKVGMPSDYDFSKAPPSYNAWLLFRRFVDVILINDVASYLFFIFYYMKPPTFSILTLISYGVGILLALFAAWSKSDAYRVVKDFAWYWGDFFFLVEQKLTFDRVFSISPHPMYTIGYSFYYGAVLITQSPTVLVVSLIEHFCQLAFLSYVENPHIEKVYPSVVEPEEEKKKILKKYFHNEVMGIWNLKNFQITSASDVLLFVVVFYALLLNFVDFHWSFFVLQVVFWRLVQSFGLGYVLHLQSKSNFWNNQFVSRNLSKELAFENWKIIFNLVQTLNYTAFLSLTIKMSSSEQLFNFKNDFESSTYNLIGITFGIILISIHAWSSQSTFEVLGDFGWFYGDFFIEEAKDHTRLYYTGIYRFINNPDSTTGFAGYYGLAFFSGSWILFVLAFLSQICHILFVKPHMKKLYGNKIREHAGVEEGISEILSEASQKHPIIRKTTEKASHFKKTVLNNLNQGGEHLC